MKITVAAYHRLAKAVGALLTLMGAGLGFVFASYLVTGQNPFTGSPLVLDGTGLLILASIGAFALPLGLSLFSSDSSTSARLRIAAFALGLMAVIRLAGFANADIRAAAGFAPLAEFFILGSIGLVAYTFRPENESPIETRMEVELNASADQAWQLIGEQFGEIGDWASGLRASSLDRKVAVGAVRTCEINGFGPFPAGTIKEELLEFDPAARKFSYAAKSGMPRMFRSAKNRWSIEALGEDRCRVRSHASVDLHWWALPIAKLAGWGIHSEIERFAEDLRHRIERGVAHPRKQSALAHA
ncbi:MAG: SRPBCC family protein [Myxococcales bacterium FL481]|nr:MAG: SRPBCC family protein [Myxococcales bacterium FL481]